MSITFIIWEKGKREGKKEGGRKGERKKKASWEQEGTERKRERANVVGVYTPQQSRIGICIFFMTDYIQRNFLFNIWVPR